MPDDFAASAAMALGLSLVMPGVARCQQNEVTWGDNSNGNFHGKMNHGEDDPEAMHRYPAKEALGHVVEPQ